MVGTVIQERNWVIVDQLNTKIKVMKKEGDRPAVILREEQPLRVTDQVALVDPSDMFVLHYLIVIFTYFTKISHLFLC